MSFDTSESIYGRITKLIKNGHQTGMRVNNKDITCVYSDMNDLKVNMWICITHLESKSSFLYTDTKRSKLYSRTGQCYINTPQVWEMTLYDRVIIGIVLRDGLSIDDGINIYNVDDVHLVPLTKGCFHLLKHESVRI